MNGHGLKSTYQDTRCAAQEAVVPLVWQQLHRVPVQMECNQFEKVCETHGQFPKVVPHCTGDTFMASSSTNPYICAGSGEDIKNSPGRRLLCTDACKSVSEIWCALIV